MYEKFFEYRNRIRSLSADSYLQSENNRKLKDEYNEIIKNIKNNKYNNEKDEYELRTKERLNKLSRNLRINSDSTLNNNKFNLDKFRLEQIILYINTGGKYNDEIYNRKDVYKSMILDIYEIGGHCYEVMMNSFKNIVNNRKINGINMTRMDRLINFLSLIEDLHKNYCDKSINSFSIRKNMNRIKLRELIDMDLNKKDFKNINSLKNKNNINYINNNIINDISKENISLKFKLNLENKIKFYKNLSENNKELNLINEKKEKIDDFKNNEYISKLNNLERSNIRKIFESLKESRKDMNLNNNKLNFSNKIKNDQFYLEENNKIINKKDNLIDSKSDLKLKFSSNNKRIEGLYNLLNKLKEIKNGINISNIQNEKFENKTFNNIYNSDNYQNIKKSFNKDLLIGNKYNNNIDNNDNHHLDNYNLNNHYLDNHHLNNNNNNDDRHYNYIQNNIENNNHKDIESINSMKKNRWELDTPFIKSRNININNSFKNDVSESFNQIYSDNLIENIDQQDLTNDIGNKSIYFDQFINLNNKLNNKNILDNSESFNVTNDIKTLSVNNNENSEEVNFIQNIKDIEYNLNNINNQNIDVINEVKNKGFKYNEIIENNNNNIQLIDENIKDIDSNEKIKHKYNIYINDNIIDLINSDNNNNQNENGVDNNNNINLNMDINMNMDVNMNMNNNDFNNNNNDLNNNLNNNLNNLNNSNHNNHNINNSSSNNNIIQNNNNINNIINDINNTQLNDNIEYNNINNEYINMNLKENISLKNTNINNLTNKLDSSIIKNFENEDINQLNDKLENIVLNNKELIKKIDDFPIKKLNYKSNDYNDHIDDHINENSYITKFKPNIEIKFDFKEFNIEYFTSNEELKKKIKEYNYWFDNINKGNSCELNLDGLSMDDLYCKDVEYIPKCTDKIIDMSNTSIYNICSIIYDKIPKFFNLKNINNKDLSNIIMHNFIELSNKEIEEEELLSFIHEEIMVDPRYIQFSSSIRKELSPPDDNYILLIFDIIIEVIKEYKFSKFNNLSNEINFNIIVNKVINILQQSYEPYLSEVEIDKWIFKKIFHSPNYPNILESEKEFLNIEHLFKYHTCEDSITNDYINLDRAEWLKVSEYYLPLINEIIEQILNEIINEIIVNTKSTMNLNISNGLN